MFQACTINSIQRKKLPQVDNNRNIFLSEGLRLTVLPRFVELFSHVFDTLRETFFSNVNFLKKILILFFSFSIESLVSSWQRALDWPTYEKCTTAIQRSLLSSTIINGRNLSVKIWLSVDRHHRLIFDKMLNLFGRLIYLLVHKISSPGD